MNSAVAAPYKYAAQTAGSALGTTMSTVGSVGNSLLYYLGPLFGLLALVLIVALIALASSNSKGTSLAQRKAPAAKPAPKVEPKAVKPAPAIVQVPSVQKEAPAIVKVEKKPTLQPKSVIPAPVAPIAAAPVVEDAAPVAVVEEAAPVPVVAAIAEPVQSTVNSTFEAYRKAMLNNNPRRQMEESMRGDIQMKNSYASNALWRESAASLKSALKNESVESYLDRTNQSVNDRMVGIFNAVNA